jgi:Carboxypeptidase regulatory-like domain
MRTARLIASFFLLLVGATVAQTTYTVEAGKTLPVSFPGATAAYSLSSSIADASFSNGVLRVRGVEAGRTTVMVVSPAGVQTLPVVVMAPVSTAAPGSDGGRSEAGTYSVQYSSDPQQVTNSLDYTRQVGSSYQRLQFADTAFLSSSSSFTTLPVLSLRVHTSHYDATFGDLMVDNSALTAQQVVIRGVHFSENGWEVHAGYASMLSYQNVLLATDPEYAVGLSRRFHLSKNSLFSTNLYYFQNPHNLQQVSPNGPILTFGYDYKRGQALELTAEAGIGAAPAFAFSAMSDSLQRHLTANFRVLPSSFPALALNSQHGVFGDLQFSNKFNSRYSALCSANLTDYDLPFLREKTYNLNGTLNRRIGELFTVSAGSTYTGVSSPTPPASRYQSLTIPIGLSYQSRAFSAGAQYLPTSDLGGHAASGYQFNAGVPIQHFQLSASYRHDVEIPTVDSILAEVPGLQDLLLRAGILSASLDDVLALLNNSAELNALGFSNLVGINLATTRDDFTAGLTWAGRGKHQDNVNFTYYDSASTMPGTELHFRSESVIASRKLGSHDQLTAAVSLYQTDMAGGSGIHPAVQISFTHSLTSVLPIPFLLKQHGRISGHVFYDPASSGRYSPSEAGVAGAEVWLDQQRKTRTDAHGYYVFIGVPYGDHRIEVKFNSNQPYFFTTDSPTTAAANSVMDFGLNFVQCQIFGVLHNDAGAAIAGITVQLKGRGLSQTVVTSGDGSFQFRGLIRGNYTISPDVTSFPPGYDLQDVTEKKVSVQPGEPAHVEFSIRALRSISGVVSVYDPDSLKLVPLSGAAVRIIWRGIETKTDATGHYILRNLPPGVFIVTAERPGSSRNQTVEVPPQPAVIRGIDFELQ